MVALLQAPSQLCSLFFVCVLFCTLFDQKGSTIISYDRQTLLDIWFYFTQHKFDFVWTTRNSSIHHESPFSKMKPPVEVEQAGVLFSIKGKGKLPSTS